MYYINKILRLIQSKYKEKSIMPKKLYVLLLLFFTPFLTTQALAADCTDVILIKKDKLIFKTYTKKKRNAKWRVIMKVKILHQNRKR